MTRVTAARIGFDVRETGGRGQNPRRGGLNSRFGRDDFRPERLGPAYRQGKNEGLGDLIRQASVRTQPRSKMSHHGTRAGICARVGR